MNWIQTFFFFGKLEKCEKEKTKTIYFYDFLLLFLFWQIPLIESSGIHSY